MAEQGVAVHPMGALMRRFVVDWLDRADTTVPPRIMAPHYSITIAGVEMAGRDAYLEATSGQLARFPGLTVTVHDAVYSDDGRAALRFTEHGASARGGAAAWRGIGLFRAEGTEDAGPVLVHNATEEDYFGRRRQLIGGTPDPVDPPMVAPWTEPPAGPDADAEEAVRTWLAGGGAVGADQGVVHDDETPDTARRSLIEADACEIDDLFAVGRRVAFHAVQRGRYIGDLADTDVEAGPPTEARVAIAGLVDVAADGAISGHVVRDRLGLRRIVTGGSA